MQAIRLETARLVIREFRDGDWEAFDGYSADPAAARAWAGPVTPESTRRAVDDALAIQQRLPRNRFHLAVEVRSSGELIGDVEVSRLPGEREAELSVILAAAARGRGYGTELAVAMARWARDTLGMERVVGYCEPGNAASRRVLEKAGFVLERMWTRPPGDPAGEKWPEACVYLFAPPSR